MHEDEAQRALAQSAAQLFKCAAAPHGKVRIRTPLCYSDGAAIDIFARRKGPDIKLSDLGKALSHARLQRAEAQRTPEHEDRIEQTCAALGLTVHRGMLTLTVRTREPFARAVLRLAQGAARIGEA